VAVAVSLPPHLEAAGVTDSYDAVVIGGGPAGSTAALLLAQAGWSVALVERREFPRHKVCGEYLSATNLPLLDRLGIGTAFRDLAGPPVRRVGLFAGQDMLSADLPRPDGAWGRALPRVLLDTLLRDEARRAGAELWQPATVLGIAEDPGGCSCEIRIQASNQCRWLAAPVMIAAHGSWDTGALPTLPPRRPPDPGDLLGFKAHFVGSSLPDGMMPLLAFPGGYGGMVHCGGGTISLSCCIRRDQLGQARAHHPGGAGEAVRAHIEETCRDARDVLARSRTDGPWLAAGPIRPGMRLYRRGTVFPVGNAAGEAHPVIAEGISIAMQSSWLLCRHLVPWRARGARREELVGLFAGYAADWRRRFAPRLRAAEAIAHWAMHPAAVAATVPLLRRFPALLSWGARLSGKANRVVPPLPRSAARASHGPRR
jgi:flavin-dependent dehydrogenase